MPVFLELMILPALAAGLVAFGITNLLELSWQARVVLSLIVLALGYAISRWVHSQRKAAAGLRAVAQSSPVLTSSVRTPLAPLVFPLGDGPPITLQDGRILIRQSPEYLIDLCRDLMRVQIERVTAPYIGKWMIFIGRVDDVSNLTHQSPI